MWHKACNFVTEYASSYIPKSRQINFSKPLQSLSDAARQKLSFNELLDTCDKVNVTEEMVMSVEEATREQSVLKLWHTYRAGRITASRMKSVCRTDHTKPALNLIKSICYPEAYRYKTAATQWGCHHKKLARQHYVKIMQEELDSGTIKISS